jgi:hypothetical protein
LEHALIAALLISGAQAAPAAEAAGVAALGYFVGSWTGEENASFGSGQGERRYRFILDGAYLISENRSRFPPQGNRTREERHEDWTIFSYDKARATYVVRQFNSEGFVNTLAMDPASAAPRRMRFVGESSENAPPGTQVTLEYERVSENEFVERFEVRFPGSSEPLEIRNRWRRKLP